MSKLQSSTKSVSHQVFHPVGACLMVLVVLYFGRPVLLPVALSVLLAFILTPLVVILEKWRMGRVPSVLSASFLAFAMIGFSGWALVAQLHGLAEELPNHQREIKQKINSLSVSKSSTFSRLSQMFEDLQGSRKNEAVVAGDGETDRQLTKPLAQPATVVLKDEQSQFAKAIEMIHPVIEPLATGAMVIVLVIFLLICREDVRFRMISLMGDAALTGTTRLMMDTAKRVSSYLLNWDWWDWGHRTFPEGG